MFWDLRTLQILQSILIYISTLNLPNLERVSIGWTNDNRWSYNIKAALHRDFGTKI